MKKIIVLTSLCLLGLNISYAQDCKICGTWIGTYNSYYVNNPRTATSSAENYGTWKMYIRVTKNGDTYNIRIKREIVDINRVIYDDDDIQILEADDRSIYWMTTNSPSPNYDGNDRITDYSSNEIYYSLTYNNGHVHFLMEKAIVVEYDRNLNITRRWDEGWGTTLKRPIYYDLNLYNEDDNW